jgi:two-component system chemotaxis sensor kinase CheA
MKPSPDVERDGAAENPADGSESYPEIDLSSLVPIFLAESQENLSRAELALLTLEESPGDRDSLDEVFRVVHTVKGDAATLGMKVLSQFAHRVEDALDLLRSGERRMTSNLATSLLRAVDVIGELVAERGGATHGEHDLEAILTAITGPSQDPARADDERAPGQSAAPDDAGVVVGQDPSASTLRVDVARLDQLLNLTGELSVAHSQLVQALEERTLSQADTLDLAQSTDRLYQDLQELVMKVRMVPVGPTLRRFKRMVRDQAMALGKEAMLELDGTEVELDNSVLQRLRDPLSHILRNSLAHGIETPSERIAKGKSATGRIALGARREGGGIVIEVTDDGRGLDRDAIIAKARGLGLIAKDTLPSPQELYQLVFAPGLSTAASVTDLAGRGVGLDVVHRVVSELRGVAEVSSSPDQGTTVSIRLPLTLAVIDGLHVKVSEQVFVFALDVVTEVVDLPAGAFDHNKTSAFVQLREQPLNSVRLSTLLGLPQTPGTREKLVVARIGRFEVGVVVDEILGKAQTLIKPLPKILRQTAGYSGLASLADGGIALILDLTELLREHSQGRGAEGSRRAPTRSSRSAPAHEDRPSSLQSRDAS